MTRRSSKVIHFTVPDKRRLRALFADEPSVRADLDRLGQRFAQGLALIATHSEPRARRLADDMLSLLTAAFDECRP
jgi:hypothetical protein